MGSKPEDSLCHRDLDQGPRPALTSSLSCSRPLPSCTIPTSAPAGLSQGRGWAPGWRGRAQVLGATGQPGRDQGQRTPLPSSDGPPRAVLAAAGSAGVPAASRPLSGPGRGPGRGPRAALHVVQDLRLHLVLAPVGRLELLLLLLLVLLLVFPGLAGQLLLPTVRFGRAGEEGWAQRAGRVCPDAGPRRPRPGGPWSQPQGAYLQIQGLGLQL